MTNKGVMSSGVIILKENGELISDEPKLVDIFNDFYINIVESAVGTKPKNLGNPSDPSRDQDTVLNIISNYKDNPIIQKIKEQGVFTSCKFSLKHATREDINALIKELDTGKSIGYDKIPAKYVKMTADILDEPLTKIINDSIDNNKFCENAKIAVVPPIYKKKDRTLKENYRPVSVLNVFSKIYEIDNNYCCFMQRECVDVK